MFRIGGDSLPDTHRTGRAKGDRPTYHAAMSDLWAPQREERLAAVEPLAMRLRPRSLADFVGQEHILGHPGAKEPTLLRRMISAGALTSVILHGPPGTGKTTLAGIIARESGRTFVRENAASVGVKQIREVVEESIRGIAEGRGPSVLFLDEIHRFTRSQQDVLLEDVERGRITLIGATTENPLFTVNAALISRSTLFRLEPLDEHHLRGVLDRALRDEDKGLGGLGVRITEDAAAHIVDTAEGDARRVLTALEVAVHSQRDRAGEIVIDLGVAQESVQRRMILYDRKGDQHYDHASALIKSIRGSDPDAAVYWIALMLEAGEDPRFIGRRLAISASEDIGNADPRAIMIAEAAWSLSERLGMPECRIPLSQLATYLALAPKSNAAYTAINEAMADVRSQRTSPVPTTIRDSTKADSHGSVKDGEGYTYNHAQPVNSTIGAITPEEYVMRDAKGERRRYYKPKAIGAERILADRLEEITAIRAKMRGEAP